MSGTWSASQALLAAGNGEKRAGTGYPAHPIMAPDWVSTDSLMSVRHARCPRAAGLR